MNAVVRDSGETGLSLMGLSRGCGINNVGEIIGRLGSLTLGLSRGCGMKGVGEMMF